MKQSPHEVLAQLKKLCSCFEANVKNSELFEQDLAVSRAVIDSLEKNVEIPEVIQIANSILGTDHYDGSGWYEFQLLLCDYARRLGYDPRLEQTKDGLEICL